MSLPNRSRAVELCYLPVETQALGTSNLNGILPLVFSFVIVLSALWLKLKRNKRPVVAKDDVCVNQVTCSFDTLSIGQGEMDQRSRQGRSWLKEVEDLNFVKDTLQPTALPLPSTGQYGRRRKNHILNPPKLKLESKNTTSNCNSFKNSLTNRHLHNDVTWRFSTLDITSSHYLPIRITGRSNESILWEHHPTNQITGYRDEPMEWEVTTEGVPFSFTSSSTLQNTCANYSRLHPLFRHMFALLSITILIVIYFIW